MSDGQDFPVDKSSLFGDYVFSDSSYENITNQERYEADSARVSNFPSGYVKLPYQIPLDNVKADIVKAEKILFETLQVIENDLLEKIFVEYSLDPDLEDAHFSLWSEASKLTSLSSVSVDTPPEYICFREYAFAEGYGTTAARRLVEEYREAVSHSTFSYVFYFRRLIKFILNEINCIKKSLISNFGGGYENESQQKIAVQYHSWSKMATNYAQRISNIIKSPSAKIPESELDKISKKQAVQLQTFFAVKLNAVDSEIKDVLESLKRDLVDNCDIFYNEYLNPIIRLSKDISDPLEFDFSVDRYTESIPVLAGEVFRSNTSVAGSFLSIHTDYVERSGIFMRKSDFLIGLIHQKRKYSTYISQLSQKGVKKKIVLAQVKDDVYNNYFRSLIFDSKRNDKLVSLHSRLNSLDSNDHPQYLLKDGGNIVGDISVDPGVKIDGVDISSHTHSGSDGSPKIPADNIDFDIVRSVDSTGVTVVKPSSVRVVEFIPDIIEGGVPVFDTIVEMVIPDNVSGSYTYEFLVKEVD